MRNVPENNGCILPKENYTCNFLKIIRKISFAVDISSIFYSLPHRDTSGLFILSGVFRRTLEILTPQIRYK